MRILPRLVPTALAVLASVASLCAVASALQFAQVDAPSHCAAFQFAKNIEGAGIGDEVLALDELKAHDQQSHAQRYEKVTDIVSSEKQQRLVHLTLDNGQTLSATQGHPFKTEEGWRDAILLKKGGKLLLKGGEGDADSSDAPRYATITDVSIEQKITPVFNLEVAQLHTFFVGEDGVVVHNGWSPSPTEGHHTIPREIQNLLRPSVASNPNVRGCKGMPNIKQIPYKQHREIHKGAGGGSYNERFKEELRKSGGVDKVDASTVTDIRDRLVKEFGL